MGHNREGTETETRTLGHSGERRKGERERERERERGTRKRTIGQMLFFCCLVTAIDKLDALYSYSRHSLPLWMLALCHPCFFFASLANSWAFSFFLSLLCELAKLWFFDTSHALVHSVSGSIHGVYTVLYCCCLLCATIAPVVLFLCSVLFFFVADTYTKAQLAHDEVVPYTHGLDGERRETGEGEETERLDDHRLLSIRRMDLLH